MSTKTGTATSYLDLLDKLDLFLCSTGHAWGKTYAGTGNGDLTAYLGTAASVAETFTITATSATNFTVTGSVSGALAAATVGTPYTSAKIDFTITAGGTPFVAGDTFTISTSPPWTRLREDGCPDTARRTTTLTNIANALDGSTSAFATFATSAYVEFEMARATPVEQIIIGCDTTATGPTSVQVQWKTNAGDAWTSGNTFAFTWTGANTSQTRTLTAPPGARRFWRLNFSGPASARVSMIQLIPVVGQTRDVASRAEFAWRAPGLDGLKQINIGCETYGDGAADTWNLGFAASRAWDAALPIFSQSNSSGRKWLCLVNSTVTYWFVVNGQRAIVIAKAAGLYQTAYLGFGLPYEPPSVHEWPCILAASTDLFTRRYDSTDPAYRHPMDPGRYGAAAYYPDSQWKYLCNRFNSGGSDTLDTSTSGKVWPAILNPESNANSVPSSMREGLDGSTRPLIPGVIFYEDAPLHVWGEFDGYYWTTGFGTVSEAIIRESNFDHLVVANVFRTSPQHYAAVRLD